MVILAATTLKMYSAEQCFLLALKGGNLTLMNQTRVELSFFSRFFAAENFVQNTLCVLVREEGLAAKRKRRPKYMKQTFSTVQKFTRSSSSVIRPAA